MNKDDSANRQGLIHLIFKFLLALPITLILTLLFSIIMEVFLIYKCNDGPTDKICAFADFEPNMGYLHSQNMLQTEASYLNKHFKKSVLGSGPVTLAGKTLKWLDKNIFYPLGIKSYKKTPDNERGQGWHYIIAAYNITKVVFLRLCVIFLSMPAYILFILVGAITGLVERELRKVGADIESTDKFELATKLLVPSVILCFVFYLSWPSSINPSLIIVPFAALCGYAFHLTARNYKKFF